MLDDLSFTSFCEEDMALIKADKEWIESSITEALRKRFSSKLARFQAWSPAGAFIAVLIFVLLQWNSYTVFRVHTEDRLDTIEANLRTLLATQAPQQVINEIAKLGRRGVPKKLVC